MTFVDSLSVGYEIGLVYHSSSPFSLFLILCVWVLRLNNIWLLSILWNLVMKIVMYTTPPPLLDSNLWNFVIWELLRRRPICSLLRSFLNIQFNVVVISCWSRLIHIYLMTMHLLWSILVSNLSIEVCHLNPRFGKWKSLILSLFYLYE